MRKREFVFKEITTDEAEFLKYFSISKEFISNDGSFMFYVADNEKDKIVYSKYVEPKQEDE